MSSEYNNYLNEHIRNTIKGFEWMRQNIPEIFEDVSENMMVPQINAHDDSKWSEEEYEAYDNYFYGNRTKEVEESFDLAWLHHQHNNPHHWQHWVLRKDSGDTKPLEMPKEYIIEMISDWWAFSWKENKLTEIFNWYKTNKSKIVLHPKSRDTVEDILEKLRTKIEETDYDEE